MAGFSKNCNCFVCQICTYEMDESKHKGLDNVASDKNLSNEEIKYMLLAIFNALGSSCLGSLTGHTQESRIRKLNEARQNLINKL